MGNGLISTAYGQRLYRLCTMPISRRRPPRPAPRRRLLRTFLPPLSRTKQPKPVLSNAAPFYRQIGDFLGNGHLMGKARLRGVETRAREIHRNFQGAFRAEHASLIKGVADYILGDGEGSEPVRLML